jgi:predicted permease
MKSWPWSWDRRKQDLREELESHLRMALEDHIARGETPEQARASAISEMGNLPLVADMTRRQWGWELCERLMQDLRYAARQLRKNAGVTATAVTALALGIGLSVTIFSVFYNGVLYPFPYRAAQRLTAISVQDTSDPRGFRSMFHLDQVAAFREGNHTFEDVVAYGSWEVAYRRDAVSLPVHGCAMTPNAMQFWGVPPLIGRGLTENDAKPGAAPVVLLNHAYWKSMFHGDRDVLGTTMMLDRQARTIVGVMPPRFALYGADVYIPIAWNRPEPTFAEAINSNDPFFFFATGIRKEGVSLETAGADLQSIAQHTINLHPRDFPEHFQMTARRMNDVIVAHFKLTLIYLIAAVVLLLLISSSNVASLLLTQHTARARDTALRAALGASRGRLIFQFFVESLLLGIAGCAAGCLLAFLGLRFVTLTPALSLPGEADISLNWPVLLFAVALSLLTTLLFGLFPALIAVKKAPWRELQTTGVNVSAKSGAAVRAGLVVFQVALSVLLLVFASLMMRSFLAITQVDAGIRTKNLWSAEVGFPPHQYASVAGQRAFFDQALTRIERLPGVTRSAVSLVHPMEGVPSTDDVTIPGKPHDKHWLTDFDAVSEGYFQTLGLQLLHGRTMTAAEVASGARVAMVNRALVKSYFGGEDPLGRQIKFNDFDNWPEAPHNVYFQIVGVVEDFKNEGVQEAAHPQAFIPYTFAPIVFRVLVTRTSVKPALLVEDIRKEVNAIDSNILLSHAATVEETLELYTYMMPRYRLISFGVCAGIGLSLALIGLFGILAYSVALQTHDFGVRLALGAQPGNILALVLRRGMLLVGSGIVVGLVVSVASVRLAQSQLQGISAFDPVAFAIAALTLLATGMVACIVPARRATRVNPLVALRHD